MSEMTLICCYNKKETADKMVQSAKLSDIDIDFVMIDNTNNRFSSAATALNYGAGKAKSQILVFLHQDIIFESKDDLPRLLEFLSKNKNSIVGVAGVKNGDEPKGIISTIYSGDSTKKFGTMEQDFQKVFSLDECLIATTKTVFEKINFDEKNCDNWHLYGADLCMQANLIGIHVYVMKSSVRHLSSGNVNADFYKTLKKLIKKYRRRFKRISFSYGWTYTGVISHAALSLYRIIRSRKIHYY